MHRRRRNRCRIGALCLGRDCECDVWTCGGFVADIVYRSYEDIFGEGDEQWGIEDGVPVGFWEADCPKRIG